MSSIIVLSNFRFVSSVLCETYAKKKYAWFPKLIGGKFIWWKNYYKVIITRETHYFGSLPTETIYHTEDEFTYHLLAKTYEHD